MDKKRRYVVEGSEYVEAVVQQISRTRGVKVPMDWEEGTKVVVIKTGEIEKFEKIGEE